MSTTAGRPGTPPGNEFASDQELSAHAVDTTSVHGITDTSALETTTGSAAKVTAHAALADPHPTYLTAAEGAAAYVPRGSTGDQVMFVSTAGSDANTGLEWGSAKLTVQGAIDALTTGGTIYIGEGTFTVSASIVPTNHLTLIGAGRYLTKLRSTSVDLFDITGTFIYLNFRSLWFVSSASHLFDCATNASVSLSSWSDCLFEVAATGKSAINMPDGVFIDNLMDNCETVHSNSATVPTFSLLSTTGAINSNTFRRMRCTNSGDYVFRIECNVSGFCYDNTFADINFEITNGGCIDLGSTRNTLIQQCGVYDLSGATTKDLFNVRKTTSGSNSAYTIFVHVTRRGGSLGTGLKDIKVAASQNLNLFIGCDNATGSGFTVAVAGSTGTFIGSPGVTLESGTSMNRLVGNSLATPQNATVNRPSAVTQGAGSQWFDTTLAKPIWSDGSVWRDAAGSAV